MSVPPEEFTTDEEYDSGDFPAPDVVVPVRVVGALERQEAADFGGGVAHAVPQINTGFGYEQLLQRSRTRLKAIIRNATSSTSIIAFDSSVSKVQQGLGFQLEPGNQIEWENQQPCYAVGLTASAIVSVLDERWEDD